MNPTKKTLEPGKLALITLDNLQAIHEYNMVRPGDKVLVCLSGSRDSIALLHTMHQYQFYARSKGIHFSIGKG